MRIVCISDTHNLCEGMSIPEGDLLIHAGDLTRRGSLSEVARAHGWIAGLPHPHKVVIAGNHDYAFEREPAEARALMTGVTYLEDEETAVGALRIYGSPWQPWFCDWAFNLRRGPAIRERWEMIPAGIDVLITHGPPVGHGGRTVRGGDAGCADLLDAVRRVRPQLHVFGHIHEGYGRTEADGTVFVNASSCDVFYRPIHAPVVVEL